MLVIGAGLPRTATLTQKLALEQLGFGLCYHMVDVLSDLGRVPRWREALLGNADWEELFGGYQATVDWPGAFFYQELMEAYPDARVLLSVRDGAAWEQSMERTIWGVLYGDLLVRDLSTARARVEPAWSEYIELMKEMWAKSGLIAGEADVPGSGYMARAMERYNEEVKATVPPERLLVWSPADGWEPLCEFLEVPVPEAPFPHVNDSNSFSGMIVGASLGVLNAWYQGQRQGTPGPQ
jgi:hypothetical protein